MSISHVDASLPSLQAVLPLVPPDQPTATVTSVSLHANRIEFIDPVVLAKFPNLVLLDLSSNQIKKMQGLECLGKLQELNLSNNKIDVLEGLRSLVSLRRLLLSFNNIRHLDGFVELHGDQYSLQSLDLSGNKIESIGELRYLAGCNKLRFLSLRSDPAISQKANPVCRLPELTASFVFSLLPQLISLDGKDMFGNLTEELQPLYGFEDILDLASAGLPQTRLSKPSRRKDQPRYTRSTARRPAYPPIEASPNAGLPRGVLYRLGETEKRLSEPPAPDSTAQQKSDAQIERIERLEEQTAKLLQSVTRSDPVPASFLPKASALEANRISQLESQMAQMIDLFTKRQLFDEEQRLMIHEQRMRQSTWLARPVGKQTQTEPQNLSALHLFEDEDVADDLDSIPSNDMPNVRDARVPSNSRSSTKPSVRKVRKKREPASHGLNGTDTLADQSDADQTLISKTANSRLIAELEAEEAKLRERDQAQQEEIALLKQQLEQAQEQSATVMDEATLSKQKVADLEIQLSLCNAKLSECQDELETAKCTSQKHQDNIRQLEQLTRELTEQSQAQTKHLSGLEKMNEERGLESKRMTEEAKEHRAEIGSLKSQLAGAMSHAAQLEDEKSMLSLKFLKDREQTKIKLAEYRRENEIYKGTIKQLQKDLQASYDTIRLRDQDNHQRMQEYIRTSAVDINAMIRESTESMLKKHQSQNEELERALRTSRHTYDEAKGRFERELDAERQACSKLRLEYQQLQLRFAEEQKAAASLRDKERELGDIVKQMSVALKDHKSQIDELRAHNSASLDLLEEKTQEYERRIKMLQETEGETGRRLRDSQSRVRELEDQVRQLENSRAERQLASDEASRRLAHEASELKQTLSKLETERKQLLERTDSAEQALRVKNKMLDDQNDTIRKLKQNLDNKSREHQALLADVASREQAFTQAIEEERSVSQTLKEEMDAHEQFIEDLQNASIALKSERDALRKEVAEMSRRLKERNESIELIEREVEKVKHTFHAKQESLIVDKNEALAAKANAIAEMSQQLATQESLLASLEREKSTLMDRIARLQLDVGEQRERHEAEMAALRSEVTEQKQRMDEKLTRMKSMLASIE